MFSYIVMYFVKSVCVFDIVGCFGGDEFGIILVCVNKDVVVVKVCFLIVFFDCCFFNW